MHKPIILLLLMTVAIPAFAGVTCKEKVPAVWEFEKATAMGLKLYAELEAGDARAVLVGRVGSDLSKYGLKYSHMGIAFKNHPKGRWIFTHLLNHCGTGNSALYDEGLITFFTDDPFAYEAIVVIPVKRMQFALERALKAGLGDRLHERRYSTIANPFSTRYQNSNQWLLEFIAATDSFFYSATDRASAQQVLRQMNYRPDYIDIPAGLRMGAAVTKRNVHFDDHSMQTRQSGRFPLVTVRSIVRYLKQIGAVSSVREIKLEEKDTERLGRKWASLPAVTGNKRSVPRQGITPKGEKTTNTGVVDFWRGP